MYLGKKDKCQGGLGAFYCNLVGAAGITGLQAAGLGEKGELFPGGWGIQKDPACVAMLFVCIAQNCSAAFLFLLKTVSSLARVQ